VTRTGLAGTRDADYKFPELVDAEGWHFWFRARRDLVLWALDSYLPDAGRMLEVGCGAGFMLGEIQGRHSGRRLAACDASLEALRLARVRVPVAHLFQADARRLPVAGRFDAVAALDVIEHITEDTDALAEMFRVLTPGGGLLLTVPQHRWLWGRIDEFSCHRRRYQREELIDKARATGFEVLRCTSYFMATLPFMVVSRLLEDREQPVEPTAELRLPKLLNAVFNALLVPETWAVKAGVSLPVGSSLMLIARRPS
jgi:SAM-dependent methyltransferase